MTSVTYLKRIAIAQPLINNMTAVWVFLFHVLVIGSSRGKNVKLGYSTLANLCHFAILSVKPRRCDRHCMDVAVLNQNYFTVVT